MKLNKIATVILGAAALMAAGSARADLFPDFTVNPSADPTAGPILPPAPFVADKITGNYREIITFGAGNTFSVSLQWVAGQFVANDGTSALSATTTGLGVNYGIYATFLGTGSFTQSAGITTFTLNPGGALNVFFDANNNTQLNTAPVNGSTPWAPSANGGDDQLLAFGNALNGTGTLDPNLPTCGGGGINCGSFGQATTFALTALGSSFFTSPVPFYSLSFQSGQLNNFTVGGQQDINGSLDVVFRTVPEPASLALVGIALFGLGVSARRQKK